MANITKLTLEQLEALEPFLNSKYVTPEVLARLKQELPKKPVWHISDFKVPEQLNPEEGYFGLNICIGCRRVYEISFQRDAHVLDKTQTSEPGPYCYPCAFNIIKE